MRLGILKNIRASFLKTILCLLVCFILSSLTVISVNAATTTDSDINKSVKVGWYVNEPFQVGSSDQEEKSGYSYEYLREIAEYNGWNYQYVYGDWTDLLAQLECGQIDILAGVSLTAEREETLLYPNSEMGSESYYIYQRADNKLLKSSDLSTFNGRSIGGIKDNLMTVYLEQWIEDNDLDVNIVYYDGFIDRDQALADGEIDAVVSTDNNVSSDSGLDMVTKVGAEPYYLAVSNSRPDLLSDLNSSIAAIEDVDPYFLQNLETSFYGSTLANTTLTEIEQQWLENHNTITVGYMDKYLPFCNTSTDGEATGLMTDVLRAILDKLNLTDTITVNYIEYTKYDDMEQALIDGKVDLVFPISGSWYDDSKGIDATTTVVTAGMNLVYKGSYEENKEAVFAINKNNKLQYNYVLKNYPDASIQFYNNIEECLQAVYKGKVDCTIINGLRVDLVRDNGMYNSLSMVQLSETDDRTFGVKHGNIGLLLLLNRGIKLIGSDYAGTASYKYIEALKSASLLDYFRAHMVAASIIVAIVVGIVFLVIGLYMRSIIKSRQKVEAANRAKTVFLFNMSHDIRTPMNAIIGFTRLVRENKNDPDKIDDYVNKIESSSAFLLSLINDVLEMARIESGNVVLDEETCQIEEFNYMLYSIFTEQMESKDITFTRSFNVQHKYIYCDPVKIREIFLNLISNAYKYTPRGGKVSMEVEEKPCDNPEYTIIVTTIRDNGIGMSGEFLPHLFEEFARSSNHTESKIEGTGLGMPIVKQLVDLMGGTITVDSKLGEGTAITVSIKHRISDASKLQKPEVDKIDNCKFAGKRILLAEDNALNAEIAIAILTKVGFEVDRAEDGVECIDKLTSAGRDYYDLILMDVQMPNMDGYQATREIRAKREPGISDIPIIAMTANAFEEDKVNAIEAGMNGHIAKPIDVDIMLATLNELL